MKHPCRRIPALLAVGFMLAYQPQVCPAQPAYPPSTNSSQDSQAVAIRPNDRQALLHATAFGNLADVKALLKRGVSPNTRAKNRTGRTALILAASGGHLDIVHTLIAHGARVDDRDKTGHTALNWAVMRGRMQIVEVLLDKGADINTRENGGVSPLLYAVGTRNRDMVALLLAHGADTEVEARENKMTPVLLAIEHGDTRSLDLLLAKGANVNAANADDFSPLMAAAEKGRTRTVSKLLSLGAKVNEHDKRGSTPLIFAARNGHTEVLQLLLDHGADRYASDRNGDTALLTAQKLGHNEIVEILRAPPEPGADQAAENDLEDTNRIQE